MSMSKCFQKPVTKLHATRWWFIWMAEMVGIISKPQLTGRQRPQWKSIFFSRSLPDTQVMFDGYVCNSSTNRPALARHEEQLGYPRPIVSAFSRPTATIKVIKIVLTRKTIQFSAFLLTLNNTPTIMTCALVREESRKARKNAATLTSLFRLLKREV